MFRLVRRSLNRIIELFKWPIAFFFILLIIPTSYSIKHYYIHYANKDVFFYFAVGFIFYFVARIILMGRARARTYPEVLTHEFTHCLFALLTFHKIVDIQSSWEGRGQMAFRGEGNWLIAIAPYFFPLLCFVVIVCDFLFLSNYLNLLSISLIMGILLAYHVCSVIVETHKKQTDLQKVGFGFSFCFLPGANILMFGLCFSYADKGANGLILFLKMIGYVTNHIYQNGFSGL